MAINDDAPKNTASRFLKIMCNILKKELPDIYKFISYQDTSVHHGTIYKASGWIPHDLTDTKNLITWGEKNKNNKEDQISVFIPKIRWEKQIRPEPISENKKVKKNKIKNFFN